jgi:flagella basal body P-ring formation protein FlgA
MIAGTTFGCFANVTTDKISKSVIEFVRNSVEIAADHELIVEPNQIDKRTQFPNCNQFDYSLPVGDVKRNTTVLVTCAEHPNWRIYVPTRVTWLAPILVMSRHASPGEPLDSNNVELEMRDEAHIRATHFTNISLIVGAKLKRRVLKGNPLTARDVCFVCKGDPVVISAHSPGLSLTAEGTALSSGSLGDTIRVRNNQSKREIIGQIDAVGSISVKM